MLVSIKWLREYVNIEGIAPEDLAEKITRSGIEVDAVIDRSQGMTNVVVGHVLECVKHPEADKLNICQVDVGEESYTNYLWCTKRCCRTKSNRCTSRCSSTRWH